VVSDRDDADGELAITDVQHRSPVCGRCDEPLPRWAAYRAHERRIVDHHDPDGDRAPLVPAGTDANLLGGAEKLERRSVECHGIAPATTGAASAKSGACISRAYSALFSSARRAQSERYHAMRGATWYASMRSPAT
jgi:hypothetical protein